MRFFLIAVMVMVVPAMNASAWHDSGHVQTGLIAWSKMSPSARAWVVGILKAHPRYEQDFAARMPADLSAEDQGRWLFAQATTWPDLARSFQGAERAKYHRSTWHYVAATLELSDPVPGQMGLTPPRGPSTAPADSRRRRVPATRPATGAATREATSRAAADPADEQSWFAPEALARNLDVLADASATNERKAIALCWVLHLIGDLHQPLHTGSLRSARFVGEGDRGGNSILIAGRDEENLHALWDALPGDARALPVLDLIVHRLMNDPTIDVREERVKSTKIAEWIREGQRLAAAAVYDDRVRAAIRIQEVDTTQPFVAIRVSDHYMESAKLVARRQVVLAGLRLADQFEALSAGRAAPAK